MTHRLTHRMTHRPAITSSASRAARCFVIGILASHATAQAQYEPPASYYASITTQTGATLKSALVSAMSSGHNQNDYGEARDYLPFTDANPANLTQMFEFYTGNIIQKPSASHIGFTGLFQSREHVWPDSRQGSGSTDNGTRGSRGDLHMLKPLSNSVNSSRGNDPFAGINNNGAAGPISGGYWFPGTASKGDAARIIFYGATRWGSTLSLVNGQPTTNTQMGDLASLLRFHYQDTPDLFERRRNDTIYRGDDILTPGDDSPFDGTNNRNAYIDRPEYVWSVFVDQFNDTKLSFGAPDLDGSSKLTVGGNRVLRNAPAPLPYTVNLTKSGLDGTYFSVTTAGGATSSVTGRHNAFTMDGVGSRSIQVGLNVNTNTPGLHTGTVTVENLDVTTGLGQGFGGLDGNDVVTYNHTVLAPSNPSFSQTSDLNSRSIDFGIVALDGIGLSEPLFLANIASSFGANLTAFLDLDSISPNGATSIFNTNITTFSNLPANAANNFSASILPHTLGIHSASYQLNFSDENLPGSITTASLSLALTGRVAIGGDADLNNLVGFSDLLALARNYNTPGSWASGDFDRNGIVDFADLLTLARNYGVSTAGLLSGTTAHPGAEVDRSSALSLLFSDSDFSFASDAFLSDWTRAQAMLVPEPATLALLLAPTLLLTRRRPSLIRPS